jgi:S1-C subfamily serine protease
LVALDSEPVETKFDLTYLIGLKKPGEKGNIRVLRDGELLSFEVIYQAKDLFETTGSQTPP